MHSDKLLVSTKFAPPRIGTRTISRSKLLGELQQSQHCTLGLVIGSAGFGKTTLLAQWRQALLQTGAEVAWLSLGADDRYLSTFHAYLLGALQRLGLSVECEVPLDASDSQSTDEVVAAIVDAASRTGKELYLMLDDYHYVVDSRAHRLVQKLIDHSPANLHFVLATRTAPPLVLGRLRVMAQVVQLDCAALPFDLEETRAFLETNHGAARLRAEEVSHIHELTSGWPASLQLIVAMLRSDAGARASLRELGWKSDDLQAYLAEEVMDHLPPELAFFIESVSICRRFNAPLAAHMTGCANAAQLIKRMEDENLLVYRVDSDDRQTWYRFHPLFASVIAARLAKRDADQLTRLHRSAATWFAQRQLLAEAVHHAVLGADLDFASEVIERSGPASWNVESLSPTLRLLERLPQDVLFARPRLFFLGCLANAMSARWAKAEAWLEQIQRSSAAGNPELAAGLPFLQAGIELQRGRTERVIELLEGREPLANNLSFMRYAPRALLAIAYAAAGRHSEAERCLDANTMPPEARDNEMALIAQGARPHCLLIEGRVREAERHARELQVRAAAIQGHRSVSAGAASAYLADACWELDRIDEAREALVNRLDSVQSSTVEAMLRAAVCGARTRLVDDSPQVAMAYLERQERNMRGIGQHRALAHAMAEHVRIAITVGELETAGQLAGSLDALAQSHGGARGYEAELPAMAALARARLSLARWRPEQALQALEHLHAHAKSHARGRLLVTAELLRALALKDLKRHDEVNQALARALSHGSRLGLVRTFLDEGPAVHDMLASLARKQGAQGELRGYLCSLLDRGTQPAKAEQACESPAGARAADEKDCNLTSRELAIIELIAQAMTNKRIALTLNITLWTVKWNLKNIFAKIGVSSRYDAISWARKQQLIS